MSKYNNKKCTVFCHKFDSIAEKNRYLILRELYLKGKITALKLQPKYLLQDKYKGSLNGIKKNIGAINYIADFQYIKDGVLIVEDVKGMRTSTYNLKMKLFILKYPEIEFYEIT